MLWSSIAFAGLLGGFFSCLELLTSKYPNTMAFVMRSRAFYSYGIFYGVLAAAAAAAFDFHVLSPEFWQQATKPGSGQALDSGWMQALSSPWGHAVTCGLATKSIMQLNLFTFAPNGTTSMPVGLQTFISIIEPRLLRAIVFDEFGGVRAFLEKQLSAGRDLEVVKKIIATNIPTGLPEEERKGFAAGVDQAVSPEEAMEKYLRFVGKRAFQRAFK